MKLCFLSCLSASALSFIMLHTWFEQHECTRPEVKVRDYNTRPDSGCDKSSHVGCEAEQATTRISMMHPRPITDFVAANSAGNKSYLF